MLWFYSYEVQEKAQLINGDKGQNDIYLWGEKKINVKTDTREISRFRKYFRSESRW